MAAERLALLWLGVDPASPLAWEFWLHAHTAFGRFWQTLEPIVGSSAHSHILALLLVMMAVVLIVSTRRSPTYLFLGNHAALIAAIASSLLGTQAQVSSVAAGYASSGIWAVTSVAQFSPVQILILLGGAASCLLCHIAVLRHLRERPEVVAR